MYFQLTDIYNNPSQYLNGSAPLNVTGFASDVNGANTTDKDSFLWYDELHPGEQADRIIAREFLGVVAGDSKWATYWSGRAARLASEIEGWLAFGYVYNAVLRK